MKLRTEVVLGLRKIVFNGDPAPWARAVRLPSTLVALYANFWATVYKTVRPSPSYRCPVCDVGVLWPNGWTIKMKLGKQVGLGPGHTALDGDLSAPWKGADRSRMQLSLL